jgi:Photosynthesis system II assembly factor YCF48
MLRTAAACFVLLTSGIAAHAQAPAARPAPKKVAAPQWNIQYFYDELGVELRLVGLAFPSATRGIAVGAIVDFAGAHKPKYTALVTNDAGAHWTLVPLQDAPRSIFFLDEANGWMVGRDAIWYTQEAGRSWKRVSYQIHPQKKLGEEGVVLRVAFLDPLHGFAVGLRKSAYETKDGGKTWTAVAEAAVPASNPAYSAYTQVAFTNDGRGMIVGGYTPPRRGDRDDGDLEEELRRKQVPTLTLELETVDGGLHWRSETAPLLGSLAHLSLNGAHGLGAFGYADSFEWPSEVFHFDLKTGKSTSVFKQKDRRITDVLVDPAGFGFLAAVEPLGRLSSSPIPGKVRILRSANLADWEEMKVNYKAVARSVVLAGPDRQHVWAATDTGMILHWDGSPVAK